MSKNASNAYITKSDLPTSLPVTAATWQTGTTSAYTLQTVLNTSSNYVQNGTRPTVYSTNGPFVYCNTGATKSVDLGTLYGYRMCIFFLSGAQTNVLASSSSPVTYNGTTYTATFTLTSYNCFLVAIKKGLSTTSGWLITCWQQN